MSSAYNPTDLRRTLNNTDVSAFLRAVAQDWPAGVEHCVFSTALVKSLTSLLNHGAVNPESIRGLAKKPVLLSRMLAVHPLFHRAMSKHGLRLEAPYVMLAFKYASPNKRRLLAADAALVLPHRDVVKHVLLDADLTNVLLSRTVHSNDMQELEQARQEVWADELSESCFNQASSVTHAANIFTLFPGSPYLQVVMKSMKPDHVYQLVPFEQSPHEL